ncbi:MAB_1171c family putative transporter [Pseudonocardia sp. TRM90224]|uniref:MAB_1171c family putative transporter n=1 Tax=Pseudonocardia sp. TRM90224 TaxID=2812678 RepID=UPI0027DF145D|nr:MAB_1171c family putative transporter [Pseudonocardia sp. TRM90224]
MLGATGKAVELIHSSREPRLCALLFGCLTLLGSGQIVSLPSVTHAIDAVSSTGTGKITHNVATMIGLSLLLHFFFAALRDRASARRRTTVDTVIVTAVVSCLLFLMIATPAEYRGHTLSVPYIAYPTVSSFYIVGGVYFIYVYATSAWLTWQYARTLPIIAARALWVIVLGLIGLTLTSITRVAWVGIRTVGAPSPSWLNSVNFPLSNISFILLTLGLVAVGVASALHRWSLNWRRYRQLEPLWTLMSQTYPEIVLHPRRSRRTEPNEWRKSASWSGHRRIQRRLIECRDGLVKLGPCIAQAAEKSSPAELAPSQLADIILTATRLRRLRSESMSSTTSATLDAVDINDDIDTLIAISTALPPRREAEPP